MSELQEEVKLLLNGMNEIAQTVLHDVDSKDLDLTQSFPHIHLSSVSGTPTRLVQFTYVSSVRGLSQKSCLLFF